LLIAAIRFGVKRDGRMRWRRGRRLQQGMRPQFGGDDRQIAREPLQDAQRRRQIMGKSFGDGHPRRHVHGFQHP